VDGRELHLHSMVVHAAIAFAVVAAAAFACDAAGTNVGGVAPGTWALLWRGSLVLVLLAALPATLSGITERNHMYVNWHGSHKAKLVLSLALIALTVWELIAAAGRGGRAPSVASALGLAVVVGNPLVCLALSFYGLRISLGRQAIARTSYVPDMMKTPPVDVLASAAAHVAERAKVIEVLEERG
jgi:hypothetical protein